MSRYRPERTLAMSVIARSFTPTARTVPKPLPAFGTFPPATFPAMVEAPAVAGRHRRIARAGTAARRVIERPYADRRAQVRESWLSSSGPSAPRCTRFS